MTAEQRLITGIIEHIEKIEDFIVSLGTVTVHLKLYYRSHKHDKNGEVIGDEEAERNIQRVIAKSMISSAKLSKSVESLQQLIIDVDAESAFFSEVKGCS